MTEARFPAGSYVPVSHFGIMAVEGPASGRDRAVLLRLYSGGEENTVGVFTFHLEAAAALVHGLAEIGGEAWGARAFRDALGAEGGITRVDLEEP